jgi:precorrin-3B synthase
MSVAERNTNGSPKPHEVKGWCPSLLRPMESGDGLIARIKPTAATFKADDLRMIAGMAEAHGNRQVEFTRRGNLQIRGLDHAGHAVLAEVAVSCGLAVADAAAEARRTVLTSPLSLADDPTCQFDAHALGQDLERKLVTATDLDALPGKFGFAIDGGGAVSIARSGQAPGADIILFAQPSGPAIALAGDPTHVALVEADHAVSAMLALARAFASKTGADIRRMADLVRSAGARAVLNAAGCTVSDNVNAAQKTDQPIGPIDLADGANAIAAAPPFGRLSARALYSLAGLADGYGDGTVRLTPWRSVVLTGLKPSKLRVAMDWCEDLDLIITPDDRRLRLVACTGAPGCSHAFAPALGDAAEFADYWASSGVLHVSGCQKGCAHSSIADITLVAGANGYAWISHGTPTSAPEQKDLSRDDIIARLKDHAR